MIIKNYDGSVEIDHNPNLPYILNHEIVVIVGSGSGKANVLLNLTNHQRSDVDKIYLYIKYPFELKYQLLINRRK